MNPQTIGQVGLLLGSLGAAMQWLRAQKAFPDWAFYAIAGLLAAGGVYLATDGAVLDWRGYILTNWPVLVTFFGAVTGGNSLVSNAAKGLVAKGANSDNMLIPLTDSKGSK